MLRAQPPMPTTQNQMPGDIRQLQSPQSALLKTQSQMLDYMKFTFDQQAKWDGWQDQLNIIYPNALRGMRRQVRQRDTDAPKAQDTLRGRIKIVLCAWKIL